jgi:3-hydroxyisobutyrate dehydrogenase-like beta-hydroxyacid dehydrogenase
MGEPMCRNLATKSGAAVVAFDQRAEPLVALARDGVGAAGSAGELGARTSFSCLPGEPQVRGVVLGPTVLAMRVRAGQRCRMMSTTPVALARELSHAFAARGADCRRTGWRAQPRRRRTALSIMVGGDAGVRTVAAVSRVHGHGDYHRGPLAPGRRSS